MDLALVLAVTFLIQLLPVMSLNVSHVKFHLRSFFSS